MTTIRALHDDGNRAIRVAFLASLALHAALLWVLPMLRSAQHQRANAAAPVLVRLVEPLAKPAGNQVFLTPPADPAPPAIAQSAPKRQPLARPGPVVPLVPQIVMKSLPAPVTIEPAQAPDAGTLAQYRLTILGAARRFKHYPEAAVENNWQGKVEVRMLVGSSGEITALSLRVSAGHEVLDRHALEMVERAKAAAPIPSALRGKEFAVDVPVVFNLREPGA
jgi:TonB family protein